MKWLLELLGFSKPKPKKAELPIPRPWPKFSERCGRINAIVYECMEQDVNLATQIAYILATVQLETAGTFLPVEEAFYLSKEKQQRYLKTKSYYPYYGRGLVQLTHRINYRKFEEILSLPLEDMPEMVMQPDISRFILVYGFINGSFTGVKLDRYINGNVTNYVAARRCINGTDRAEIIADLAKDFYNCYAKTNSWCRS